MKLYLFLLRRNITLFVLISALTLWALTASFFALSLENEVKIIGIDDAGTRVVTDSKDPLVKKEIVNFLRFFVGHLYNFTPEDFVTTVGTATSLMSLKLWEREKSSISSLMSSVKGKQISHFGVIKKIVKVSPSDFSIYLDIVIQEKLKKRKKKIRANLTLERIQRSEGNPWGWQVVSINESVTN